MAAHAPRVRSFHLYSRHLSDGELNAVAPALRSLAVLESLRLDALPVTDRTLHAVAASCPRLRRLGLRGCRSLTPGALAEGALLPNLRLLDLRGCDPRLTESALLGLLEERRPELEVLA